MLKQGIIIFSLICSLIGKGQTHSFEFSKAQVDSLLNLAKHSTSVIDRIKAHNHLGAFYESISDYPESKKHLQTALASSKKHALIEEEIISCNYLGYIHWHESNYEASLYYHNQALALANKYNINNSPKAFTFLMLGNDFYDKGDYTKTSEYYFKSLKLFEELNDTIGQIQVHNRLGKLYFKLKDLKNSREQTKLALTLNKQFDYKRENAVTNNNLGNIAIEQNLLDSALYFFNATYQKFSSCGDVIGQSVASINLGDTYLSVHTNKPNEYALDSALYYYKHSYILNKQVNNQFGVIYGLWGMGDVAIEKANPDLARSYYKQALQNALFISAKNEECNLYWKIYKTFASEKDSAFVYLQKYVDAKKEADQEVQTKALLRQESKYEIEKKIAEKNAEIERDQLVTAEKNKWKNLLILGVIVIALILTYAVVISIKRLRVIASKNKIINTINDELTIQRKEITDSITYARRIQEAILPSEKIIGSYFPESFVLYKPKDIVAGDFYWLEHVKLETEEFVLLAAADCTGHGVPGALVSVVCSNALNRSVNEFKLHDPGKILDKTRELVIDSLSKSDLDVKDGMDISLVSIKKLKSPEKEMFEVNWSGANNPLWYLHKGEEYILVPDKQAIGRTDKPNQFKTHTLLLEKDDSLFLFTDGYADQFGGEKQKKFKYKPLREMLFSNSQLSAKEQKEKLESTFNSWKGSLEQVDDVCVIGIKL